MSRINTDIGNSEAKTGYASMRPCLASQFVQARLDLPPPAEGGAMSSSSGLVELKFSPIHHRNNRLKLAPLRRHTICVVPKLGNDEEKNKAQAKAIAMTDLRTVAHIVRRKSIEVKAMTESMASKRESIDESIKRVEEKTSSVRWRLAMIGVKTRVRLVGRRPDGRRISITNAGRDH
jgi:hypothetical protein